MHGARTGIEHCFPGIGAAQFGSQVDCAEQQRIEARCGVGDLVGGFETLIGLNDRLEAGRQIVFVERLGDPAHFLGSLYLR